MEKRSLEKIIGMIRAHLNEEVPTNSLAHGKIAGTVEAGDDPPVRRKKKYIYQKGLRKTWSHQNGRRN
jgi:hypothetical protein